jgi:hypothetical protein
VVRYPEGVEEEDESTPLERRFMTVCVASFAARSRAIVAVADKAVTYGQSAPIQGDTDIKKMIPVGDTGWHTLIAGNPSFAVAVVEKAKTLMLGHQYAGCGGDATSMMACMRDAYQQCREALTETAVLSPYLLNKKSWAERSGQMLPLSTSVAHAVQAKLERFTAKTSLLVFGFSRNSPARPHLFSVTDPGIASNHDVAGYAAVGIGAPAAIGRLMDLEIDRDTPLDRALYETFDAKGAAEIVQGVGVQWDEWVALPNLKPINIRREIQNLIGTMFDFNIASPYARPDFNLRDRPPKNWEKRLRDYADEVMKRTTQPSRKSKSQKLKSKQ